MEHLFQIFVFPVILVFLAVTGNAMVNHRLKYAPDADTAKWQLIGLLQWPMNIGLLAWIMYDVVMAPEITKIVAFQIAIAVGFVVWLATVHVFVRQQRLIGDIVNTQKGQVELVQRGIGLAEKALNRRTPGE